jgi:hypothetical protein
MSVSIKECSGIYFETKLSRASTASTLHHVQQMLSIAELWKFKIPGDIRYCVALEEFGLLSSKEDVIYLLYLIEICTGD